jgi:hypothetical protein
MSWFLPFQQSARTQAIALLNTADQPSDQGTNRAMMLLTPW